MSLQEDLRTYRLISFTLTPGNVVEQMSLETISRHSKDKKVFDLSQHGFMKEKCLINWVIFYNEITCLSNCLGCCFCSFSKTFDAVSCKILIGELWAPEVDGEVD